MKWRTNENIKPNLQLFGEEITLNIECKRKQKCTDQRHRADLKRL